MTGIIEQIDAQLEAFFKGWNWLSAVLLVTWLAYLLYPVFYGHDPDTHPMLLSRQSHVDPVRQPGQSAFYRSLETPYGFPLKTGLNYKEPGSTRWQAGRDGDLRDVWRQAVRGVVGEDGSATGKTGQILSVLGKEEVISHDLTTITREINIIGNFLREKKSNCVAIYLPNSIELLVTVFAASFYGFHPVLLPFDQSKEVVAKLLKISNADYLIASAGSLPISEMKSDLAAVRGLMLVVEKSSRQMDWSEPSIKSALWHDIIEESMPNASSDIPANKPSEKAPDVITVWLNEETSSTGEIVALTQKNLVAAIGAQISAVPTKHRLGPSDLFLPADTLSAPYILVQTMAALFSHSSVALNTVSGPDVDLALAARTIAPTVIAMSAATALKLHKTCSESAASTAQKFALGGQIAALEAGYMPPAETLMNKLNAPFRAAIGTSPAALRLLYVFERAHAGTPPVSSAELSDLRAYTGARVIYALTSARVAGTVAQTNFYDYRRNPASSSAATGKSASASAHSHFGVAPASLSIQVVDTDTHKTVGDNAPAGELVARGPAVKDGLARLGITATFRDDGTVAYI